MRKNTTKILNKDQKKNTTISEITFNTVVILIAIICLYPMLYLAPYGRATADDIGNAILTRRIWSETHSIIKVFGGAWKNLCTMYYGWEGCYSSCFLYALQPELFGSRCYLVTPYFFLVMWFGSMWYMLNKTIRVLYGMTKSQVFMLSLIFWLLMVEFIPSTQNAIYWWSGAIHYTFAMSMWMILMGISGAYILEITDNKKANICELVLMCLLAVIIGGVNYQTSMLSVMTLFCITMYSFIIKKDRKLLLLCLPIVLNISGLIVSVIAPGNRVRGGNEISISISKVINTIIVSFAESIKELFQFTIYKPILVIGMILVFLFLINIFGVVFENKEYVGYEIKYKPLIIVTSLLIYVAMEAPLIFAAVDDATSGPANIDYMVLYLVILEIELMVAESIARWIYNNKHKYIVKYKNRMQLFIVILCIMLLVPIKGQIKKSTTYRCIEYITSGRARDFKEQMDMQTEQLLNGSGDIIVVAANNDQGPLCHSPITEDVTRYTNIVTAEYYGLDSVRIE